ncbi:MAG: mucoidy inhibitor MuiA family protein [Bacteroidia bacterium]|nr:mucoidy inhibitor MuiA family protein [Bacteroidia bacterium]
MNIFLKKSLVCLTGLIVPFISFAETIYVSKTEINQVTVFTNGAIIQRSATVSIPAGYSELKFENLPASIDLASISVTATGDFIILNVAHQLDYLGPDRKTGEMVALEDSLEKLQAIFDGNSNQIAALQEEQNVLLANKNVGGTNTGVKLEDLKSISTYVSNRILEIRNRMGAINSKNTGLKKQIDRINQQLAQLNATRNEPFSTIRVSVSANAKTSGNFKVSYFVGNVSWTPQYDIRVKSADSPVELLYKAMVTQNTGEDWNQVKVRLSTGNPAAGSDKPTLNPWYLNFQPQVMIKSEQRKNDDRKFKESMLAMPSGAVELQVEAGAIYQWVTASEGQLSTEYDIALPYTITSSNNPIAIEIKKDILPAKYSYFAVPKIEREAFLVASITGWQDFDFRQGPANIYFENTFVGGTSLDPNTLNDTLVISLGRDQRIIVKREKLKESAGNQFIGSNRTRNYTYETSLKNNRKESVTILVEEQIPVSQDKEIEVKAIDFSGGELNAETGKITWKLEIAPGQQVKKKLSFSVKHPKDRPVMGL